MSNLVIEGSVAPANFLLPVVPVTDASAAPSPTLASMDRLSGLPCGQRAVWGAGRAAASHGLLVSMPPCAIGAD